ncbi:MAG TPA: response regulator transcription factor [Bacteroidetes bacterium]|nr:response regulator transcription factor [Bacteroidota bacterium]
MDILVAEDDYASRRLLEVMLLRWGYHVKTATNGADALEIIAAQETPLLVLLDWMMPEMSGPEVCVGVRKMDITGMYIILLTGKDRKEDIIIGLNSGADDYITKPFHKEELKARLQVGERIISLQQTLAQRVADLEHALKHVDQLRQLLPICAYCKRIRDDKNYWSQLEEYFAEHTNTEFSHSICPDCFEKHVKPQL